MTIQPLALSRIFPIYFSKYSPQIYPRRKNNAATVCRISIIKWSDVANNTIRNRQLLRHK